MAKLKCTRTHSNATSDYLMLQETNVEDSRKLFADQYTDQWHKRDEMAKSDRFSECAVWTGTKATGRQGNINVTWVQS
jgi:hypothetical protein